MGIILQILLALISIVCHYPPAQLFIATFCTLHIYLLFICLFFLLACFHFYFYLFVYLFLKLLNLIYPFDYSSFSRSFKSAKGEFKVAADYRHYIEWTQRLITQGDVDQIKLAKGYCKSSLSMFCYTISLNQVGQSTIDNAFFSLQVLQEIRTVFGNYL